MESCPWCGSRYRAVREIRFGIVPCANDWHTDPPLSKDHSEIPKPQRLYAFWKYDMFPTQQCLGGEISKFGKNGSIERVGSPGFFYKPFKICLLEEGLMIQAKLDELDSNYRSELKALKEKYSKLHDNILEVPK